ncbi:MAG TPA: tripartite tricarboxylate transporter substrate-binding protein, partial [Burkholderiales bacterium]|nr:tripartite tricarboxylate transporter substrate-binding protein [Burkholderiales bacterium]
VANMLSALPLAKTGKLRVRGISTAARSRAMPELPTIAEAGVPGFEGVQWNGVFRAYWDAARYHRASQSRHRSTSAAAGYTRAYPC